MRWRARGAQRAAPEEAPREGPVRSAEGGREAPVEGAGGRYAQPGGRRGFGWRAQGAGAAAVGTAGFAVVLLARLVMLVAVLIAVLIGLAIILADVKANAGNSVVKGIHEGANFFAGAFTGMISYKGHPARAITVNWGIALIVYLVVGALIAAFIASIGRGGARFGRTHRAAPSH